MESMRSRITNGGWLLVTNAHIVGTKTVDGKVDGRCRKGSGNCCTKASLASPHISNGWRCLVLKGGVIYVQPVKGATSKCGQGYNAVGLTHISPNTPMQ